VNVAFSAQHYVFPWGECGGIITGGGSDTVKLKNDTFVAVDLFGRDGCDHLRHNHGLFTIDGFEQ